MNTITIRNARPADAQAIYETNCAAYNADPILDARWYVQPESVMRHIERFPEGVFVAEHRNQVVGFALTMRTSYAPEARPRSWSEAIGGLELRNHDPKGDWIYGIDFGVRPDYRKRGIGTRLYKARFAMIERLNLKGYYAGGMLPGYARHAHEMTLQEYGEAVRSGEITDPTVTMQINRGFEAGQVIPYYCGASEIDCSAMVIVWRNRKYRPALRTARPGLPAVAHPMHA